MIPRLEALGLGSYEARALAHLLRHGERTGPDLARETGIPFGRVYGTLHDLVGRGLALDKGGRPRRFQAVPAETVPARLLASSQRRLQEQERLLQGQAATLERELEPLARSASQAAAGGGVRMGEDAARDLLVEATHAARTAVDAYLALEAVRDEDLALLEAFKQAVERGVRTRVLLREADVDYLMQTPYVGPVLDALVPHLGASLQVRLTRSDTVPFSVLDGRRVMIGVRNPLATGYLAVVHLDDPTFAGQLELRFGELWDQAALDRGILQRVLRRLQEDGRSTATGRLLEAAVRRKARSRGGSA